jgi:hypothetical protein
MALDRFDGTGGASGHRDVERMIANDPEALADFREAVKEQTHDRGNQHTGGKRNNVTLAKPATGNGKAYTLSRLKRETPELFAAVVRGELSANAAAVVRFSRDAHPF